MMGIRLFQGNGYLHHIVLYFNFCNQKSKKIIGKLYSIYLIQSECPITVRERKQNRKKQAKILAPFFLV